MHQYFISPERAIESASPTSLLQSRGEYIDFAIMGIYRNKQITAGDKIRKQICLGTLSQESCGNECKGPRLRARASWLMLIFVNSNICMKEYFAYFIVKEEYQVA